MEISPESRSTQDIYKILIGTVLPRPIAWVSTVDPSGNMNLALLSTFERKFNRERHSGKHQPDP